MALRPKLAGVAVTQSMPKRAFMLLLNLAAIGAAVAIVVFGGPALAPEAGVDRAEAEGQKLVTPVRLLPLTVQDNITVQRQFFGRLEAKQSADIGFEFGGVIRSILVEEGDAVRRGEKLASLNTDALLVERQAARASLEAAQAQLDFAVAEVARLEPLVSRGLTQRARLDEFLALRDTRIAQLAEVKSAVDQAQLKISKANLNAPFDGIIGATTAGLGQTVAPGQTILSVFESGGANFRVRLPTTLDPAALQNPRIRVNGEEFGVTLRTVRPDIDFRTNTRIAIFEVQTDSLNSFGLSATLFGDVTLPLRGAWVPVDAMRPSAEGYWTVLSVDDASVAQRIAVEILHQREDEAYVIGAFESGTLIIGDGAHKVVPGQMVRAE